MLSMVCVSVVMDLEWLWGWNMLEGWWRNKKEKRLEQWWDMDNMEE
jgi:hypothetical protein